MPVKKLAEIINLGILLSVLVSFLNLSTDLVSSSDFCTSIMFLKISNAKKSIARKRKCGFFLDFFVIIIISISPFIFFLIYYRLGTEMIRNS